MSTTYETEPEAFWEINKPLAIPGETAGRIYAQVTPTTSLAGNYNLLPQVSFQFQNPTTFVDLANSYIEASFQILASNGAAYTAGQQVSLVREPVFFRSAQLQIGGAPVEVQSSYQSQVQWLRRVMNTSAAVKSAQGVANLSYPDVVTVPANESTWPSATLGCQSVNLYPLGAGGGAYTTAVANPAYNSGNELRLKVAGPTNIFNARIPLKEIYSFVSDDIAAFWGGNILFSLQPAAAADVIFNSVDTTAYLACSNMSLWICTKQPRVDVQARLLKEASLGVKQKFQWLAADCPQVINVPAGALSINAPITLPNFSPQYLALLFRPASYTTESTMNTAYLPPNTIGAPNSCPYSSAYVSYDSKQCPQFAYGAAGASDNERIYREFVDFCGQDMAAGAGCYVDRDQFEAQMHVTIFDLRNRAETAAPASIPSNTCTVVANLRTGITVAANCYVIAFGVKEAEWSYAVNGIAITSQ